MVQETPPSGSQANRVFEQAPDAISLYSDFAQIVGTGREIVLQFYETIPGTPGPGGHVQMVRTRLRATITVSPAHAANIGKLLIEQTQPAHPQAESKEGEKR